MSPQYTPLRPPLTTPPPPAPRKRICECGTPLPGRQIKYCSPRCKSRFTARKWKADNLDHARDYNANWKRRNVATGIIRALERLGVYPPSLEPAASTLRALDAMERKLAQEVRG